MRVCRPAWAVSSCVPRLWLGAVETGTRCAVPAKLLVPNASLLPKSLVEVWMFSLVQQIELGNWCPDLINLK